MNNYEKLKLEPKIFNCSEFGVESMEGTGVPGRRLGVGGLGGQQGHADHLDYLIWENI